MLSIKFTKGFTGPAVEKLYDLMVKGDPRCAIPIAARVMKVQEDSLNSDVNPIGSLGGVIGNIHHEEGGDAYLVKFDLCSQVTFMVASKIIQV